MTQASKSSWTYSAQLNFMAVVDTICPSTVYIHEAGWSIQYGGIDLDIWGYLLMEFDSLPDPLSEETSQLFDAAALHYCSKQEGLSVISQPITGFNGFFSTLSREDRLMVLALLENLQIPLENLPGQYQNNPALIRNMINSIYQLTIFGYYSEWYGYGAARTLSPESRHLCTYPISWGYTGYPGPSFGYRVYKKPALTIKLLQNHSKYEN
ncbi:hypothetical protein JOC77_000892 [Peribacillus deserti]|uniref:Gluconate 2-dehydrogenase subunit 3 family protein n=1 Tax=Peribacillus deserti TaxID=673318 RepID=A0ABS2QE93_9BACI|nr:hypothetical protein [Peribacillus deserti]MBM7691487.1 hypothetical protein [Peribacillus deserti]